MLTAGGRGRRGAGMKFTLVFSVIYVTTITYGTFLGFCLDVFSLVKFNSIDVCCVFDFKHAFTYERYISEIVLLEFVS